MNFNRDLLSLNKGHFQKAWYPRTRNEIFYIMVHLQSNFKFLPKTHHPSGASRRSTEGLMHNNKTRAKDAHFLSDVNDSFKFTDVIIIQRDR